MVFKLINQYVSLFLEFSVFTSNPAFCEDKYHGLIVDKSQSKWKYIVSLLNSQLKALRWQEVQTFDIKIKLTWCMMKPPKKSFTLSEVEPCFISQFEERVWLIESVLTPPNDRLGWFVIINTLDGVSE